MRARRRERQRLRNTAIAIMGGLLLVFGVLIASKLIEQRAPSPAPAFLEESAAPSLTPGEKSPAPTPKSTPQATGAFVEPASEEAVWPLRTPEPIPRVEAAKPDYSFFYFTDTQHYSKDHPDTFIAMTAWMRDHIETYDVRYAFFTGDFVQDRKDDAQWTIADQAVRQLEGSVPLFAIAGNHDVGSSSPNYGQYLKYFPASRFAGNTNIVSWFENGKGRCDAVNIDGTDYLFVGLGWGSGNSGIDWMNKQLAAYPNHKAILLFHDYMGTDGLLSGTGEQLYSKVVKKNKNVFMVLCGHRYNCAMLTTDIDDDGDHLTDRTVYHIMMNYQAFDNGGDGYLTLIRVYKKDRIITFDTYSPTLDKWYHFAPARSVNKEHLVLPVAIFDPAPTLTPAPVSATRAPTPSPTPDPQAPTASPDPQAPVESPDTQAQTPTPGPETPAPTPTAAP